LLGHTLQHGNLFARQFILSGFELGPKALEAFLNAAQVSHGQLEVYDFGVTARVNATRDVDYVRVAEGSHYQYKGVYLADNGQELVP
jgi:hypothetical protein